MLVEDAETQALEAATQMQRAGTPALAVAAAKGVVEAAAQSEGQGQQTQRAGPEVDRLPRHSRGCAKA